MVWRVSSLTGRRSNRLTAMVALTILSCAVFAPAAAALEPVVPTPTATFTLTDPGPGVAFGTALDWASDSAAAVTSRLGGRPPVLFSHSMTFPLEKTDRLYVDQFFAQVKAQGGAAMLTLTPQGGLSDDSTAITDLASALQEEQLRFGVPTLLDIAPEMNAPWHPWGQHPVAYVQAFRAIAKAVRTAAPAIKIAWEPAQGNGYPFRPSVAVHNDGNLQGLDTDQNATLDGSDDPYAPYFPGNDVVDWVGLSVSAGSFDDQVSANTVPAPGTFATDLSGSGSADGVDFYSTYARRAGKPMLVETAARYVPTSAGASESAVKRNWWLQAVGRSTSERFPALHLVIWQERFAGNGDGVDLRITATPGLASTLGADLAAQGVTLGVAVASPVGEVGAVGTTPRVGPVLRGWAAWLIVAAVALLAVALMVTGFSGRSARWAYQESGPRDLRVDLLRGVAIVFVVINHLELSSLYQILSEEAVGVVSGAELFVLLSGAVIGLVYRPRLERDGLFEVTTKILARSWKLYYTALIVVLVIFLCSRIPRIDASALTTFTDQGTGGAGSAAAGRVYDLYTNAGQLFAYPVPGSAIADVLLLRFGPWQFNVMGLYVVLLLITPALLWAMSRRLVPVVLALSWALYIFNAIHPVRVLPAQFEDSFPLLTWQVLFISGLTAGYYREAIVAWFRRRWSTVVLVIVICLCLGFLFIAWNNPYQANRYDVRLGIIPGGSFQEIYRRGFGRTYLEFGRLINVFVLVVTAYALLTAFWKPIYWAVGRFLVPLGQATLYVFIVHVFVILLLRNVAVLDTGNLWWDTVTDTAVLAALWWMVRRKFLYRMIPR